MTITTAGPGKLYIGDEHGEFRELGDLPEEVSMNLIYEPEDGKRDHAWGLSWLHRLIYNIAWPSWDCCENCVGQEWGCYCDHYGAVAPGVAPSLHHHIARWLWVRVRKDRDPIPAWSIK